MRRSVLLASVLVCLMGSVGFGQTPEVRPADDSGQLKSGEYFVTQSWSQEKEFARPYLVRVPAGVSAEPLPVFIFLHGNGGTAARSMTGTMRRLKRMADGFVMVFPDGYQKSWNIVSERSKADDKGFIESIIRSLSRYDNVRKDGFVIMGNSNGAALVNQLAIESKLPQVRHYISAVSPLNVHQHDGVHFRAKGDDNRYQVVAEPMAGKRLLNISGVEDGLVPYGGGPSPRIPANDGKLAFVDAERSTFLWAKQMGYTGEQLAAATATDGELEIFSYSGGDVVHIKVNGVGHGAGGAVSEEILMRFIEGKPLVESKN